MEVYHVVSPEITWTIQGGGHCGDSRRAAKPTMGLYKRLKGKVEGLHAVGDCAQPRDIEMATYEAHKVAVAI